MGGPFWSGQLHDRSFVDRLLEHLQQEESKALYLTHSRMLGMMSVIREELDELLYYELPSMSSLINLSTPPLLQFRSALLNAGYQVSATHCNQAAFKTNAPVAFLWDVLRACREQSSENRKKDPAEQSVAAKLLKKERAHEISFEKHELANPASRQQKLIRFECHVGMNWGPKSRAKMTKKRTSDALTEGDDVVVTEQGEAAITAVDVVEQGCVAKKLCAE